MQEASAFYWQKTDFSFFFCVYRYVYQLEASTWGGSNTSDKYIIQTPLATPEEIGVPYNVTVIDAYSIFVAWNIPGKRGGGVCLCLYALVLHTQDDNTAVIYIVLCSCFVI